MSKCNPRRLNLAVENLEGRLCLSADIAIVVEPQVVWASPGEQINYSVLVSNLGSEGATVDVTGLGSGLVDAAWRKELNPSAQLDILGFSQRERGFVVRGQGRDDSAGSSAAGLGDVNGDGFDDIAVGVPGARPDDSELEVAAPGEVYIVFGSEESSVLVPSQLDGVAGFVISGIDGDSSIGQSVSGVGDVNGDGVTDILIAVDRADDRGIAAGEVYVLFGSATGFPPKVDLALLDGTTGFLLLGIDEARHARATVSRAGDVNGDGLDDILFATRVSESSELVTEAAYVVFGSRSAFPAVLDTQRLNGSNGFVLRSLDPIDSRSVSGGLDINGDGFGDLLIPGAGVQSYVVFGATGGFPEVVETSSLDGNNGFVIDHESTGVVLAPGGDVNGDGIDDLLVGDPKASPAGTTYVVFGSRTGYGENLDLSEQHGLRVIGAASSQRSGAAVSGIGDINADGFDDIAIGAPNGIPPDSDLDFDVPGRDPPGLVYVLHGFDDSSVSTVELAELDGRTGFVVVGYQSRGKLGSAIDRAGDVNGDGVTDLLVGVPIATPPSPTGSGFALFAGEAYVIFGRRTDSVGHSSLDTVSIDAGESVAYFVSGTVPPFSTARLITELTVSLTDGEDDDHPDNNTGLLVVENATNRAGDLDLDGAVAFSDFLILSANFGRNDEDVGVSDGDLDGDGRVAFSDFLILSANFGAGAS